MRSLTKDLLRLAAAQAFGGAEAVVSELATQLVAEVPFRSGEVVLTTGGSWRAWPLVKGGECLAGDELLDWLGGRGKVLQVDDTTRLPLPETRHDLVERGLRSLLACPLGGAGAARGALILYHEQGWAFAGVSTRWLEPLAQMLGHCMWSALRLEELSRENHKLRAQPFPPRSGQRARSRKPMET